MTFEHRVLILSMYVGRFEAELLVEDREYLTRAAAAGSEGAAGKSIWVTAKQRWQASSDPQQKNAATRLSKMTAALL